MERRIDLDAAAREIDRRVPGWRASGLSVGDITWRERGNWPATLATAREDVRDPESIGIRCVMGDQEGRLVLFDGGWADLEYWSGKPTEEPLVETPGYGDWLTLESYGAVLDRFFEMFDST